MSDPPNRARSRHFSAATRCIAYACRILVADATGAKTLKSIGKGSSRIDREIAVVREVFGNIDTDKLRGHLEREWENNIGARTSSFRGHPTGSQLSNIFWTLFCRRVYHGPSAARFKDPIDVSRSLVISGGGVGTRRKVCEKFFAERRVSPRRLKVVLRELVSKDDKAFARDWFKDMKWDVDIDVADGDATDATACGNGSPCRTDERTSSSSCESSYMQHPLDMPLDVPVDFIEPECDFVRRDDIARTMVLEDGDGGDARVCHWFECASGCGRAWDGNSQCQC